MSVKKLLSQIAKSSEEAEQSELAGRPEVGIFWIHPITHQMFGDHSTPLDVGVGLDGSKTEITTPYTHLDTWKLFQNHGMLPLDLKDKKWNEVPRGRVFYDSAGGKFHVVGHKLIQTPEIQEQIRSRFHLPSNALFYYDDHYKLRG